MVAEYNGAGTLQRRYVHGPGSDEPLLWYEGAAVSPATRRSLQVNYQGSIDSVADASGNLIAIDSYDEYGRPGANNIGSFQYTGQVWLPELGIYYYKARMYDPRLGRFLQTDPVGYTDDLDLYAYVENDPVDGKDPTGEWCVFHIGTTCPPPPPTDQLPEVQVKGTRLRSSALAGVTLVGVSTSEIGVGDVILIGVGVYAGIGALYSPSGRDDNTMSATASGDPPVPGATPGDSTKGRTKQWEKSGGQAQADEDFDNLKPTNVRPIPGGRAGTLPDGRKVNVRGTSTAGRPTLEIQDGDNRIKVRYNP